LPPFSRSTRSRAEGDKRIELEALAAPSIHCGMASQRGQTTRRQMVKLLVKKPQASRHRTCRRMRRSIRPKHAAEPKRPAGRVRCSARLGGRPGCASTRGEPDAYPRGQPPEASDEAQGHRCADLRQLAMELDHTIRRGISGVVPCGQAGEPAVWVTTTGRLARCMAHAKHGALMPPTPISQIDSRRRICPPPPDAQAQRTRPRTMSHDQTECASRGRGPLQRQVEHGSSIKGVRPPQSGLTSCPAALGPHDPSLAMHCQTSP
jgi:hypothetical protein